MLPKLPPKAFLSTTTGSVIVKARPVHKVLLTPEQVNDIVYKLKAEYLITKHNIEEAYRIGAIRYVKKAMGELKRIRKELEWLNATPILSN